MRVGARRACAPLSSSIVPPPDMLRRVTRTGALAARLAKFSRVARADIVPLSVEWHRISARAFEFFLSAAKLTKLDVEEAGTSMGAGGMTTVWRPRVRIPVPEVDDEVEVGVEVPEEVLLTVKGAKRKRAPHKKGPCEHGVKYRSRCKVCSACPHGRQRYQCKECGGSSICEHGRMRSQCKECGGLQSASTVVIAILQEVRGCILRARS